MADLVQARADYAENSVEPGTAPDTDAGPDTSTGIDVDTDMETGTGIDSEPDTADGRADERAARAYQVLLVVELFEAKHCEMCDENDCTADNPMYECDTCHRMYHRHCIHLHRLLGPEEELTCECCRHGTVC
jgi:hypothetical protein